MESFQTLSTNVKPVGDSPKGGLSTANALDSLCIARDTVLKKVAAAQALLREASSLAKTHGLGDVGDMLQRVRILDATPGTISGYTDAQGWDRIFTELGLRSFMHTKAREDWEDAICNRQVPALTIAHIHDAMGTLHGNRKQFLEQGVVEVFRTLSYDFKSNAPVKFSKRAVIEGLHYMQHGSPQLSLVKCSQLDDLLRLLCVANGSPEDTSHSTYTQLNGDTTYKSSGATQIENGYYTLKVFKKGTAHIVFKRADLVDTLNKAIGQYFPNTLPPPQ